MTSYVYHCCQTQRNEQRGSVCNKCIVLIVCCLVLVQARNGALKMSAHGCKTSEVLFCTVEEACYSQYRMTRREVREFYAAQYTERARRDPGCPEQNGPLMMRCSCKCGCRRVRAKLNICSKCNNIVCHANCCIYHRCHWCLRYPEDRHSTALSRMWRRLPEIRSALPTLQSFFVRGMLQTR